MEGTTATTASLLVFISVSSTSSGLTAGGFSAAAAAVVLDRSLAVCVSFREEPMVIPECFRFLVVIRFTPGLMIDFLRSTGLACRVSGTVGILWSASGEVDETSRASATGTSAEDAAVEVSASGIDSVTLTTGFDAILSLEVCFAAGGGDFNDALTDALLPAFFPALGLAFPTGRNPIFFFFVTFLEDTKVVIGSDMMDTN